MSGRLRLAVPNKGRLSEPSVDLLRSAGLDFELSERRLSALVTNADLELLFVRTEDVAEYVADGLVELGLTGADLVADMVVDRVNALQPQPGRERGGDQGVLVAPPHGRLQHVDQRPVQPVARHPIRRGEPEPLHQRRTAIA